MKKKKLLSVLAFILSILVVILVISKKTTKPPIESSDLVGEHLKIGFTDSLSVAFNVDENRCIETDFYLIPTSTSLTVKYIGGNCENLEIFLYDADYSEYVQSGILECVGESITFTHLFGGKEYYIQANAHVGDSDKIILRFST